MLYLTDFPSTITEQDIKSFLSKYLDNIIEISKDQNQKNKEKRKPLSYKVSFNNFESANKCRMEMNLRKIRNKSIRIMWDEKDSSITHNTKNNLFFKGIPKSTSPREVYEYFIQFGDIFSCKMTEDDFGNHYGYGYITYYNSDDAQKALENTKDKKIFDSNIINISYFQKKNERLIKTSELNKQKIYIGNLPKKYETVDLTKLCNEYGEVKSCNIFIDNLGKNFGIVQFSSENEAKDVVTKLDGKEIDDVKLIVKLYQNKYEQKQNLENSTQRLNEQNSRSNLHIRNIPLTAKEEDLIKIFSKYGKVTSARIEKDKIEKIDGENSKIEFVSKGFGYVSFDNAESAQKAIDDLNGKYLPGFESWSHTLIIELFMTKYERQFIEKKDELSSLSYFTNKNNQENFHNFEDKSPSTIFPPQMFTMPMLPYNQFNQFDKFNQINIFNQFNQFNQYHQLLTYANQRFNNQQKNHNQYMKFNNSGYKNNYGYYRGKGFRGGHYRNNRNKNYNKKNYQKYDENENNKNKLDLSEYNKLKTPEEQKEYLGELLFESINNSSIIKEKKVDIKTIGKITGMILELPNRNEIFETLENSSVLRNRIDEALNLLNWKS